MKSTYVIILILFICSVFNSFGQKSNFKYISPKPGAKYIMPGNNIALRHGDPLPSNCLRGFNIKVFGTKTGSVEGKLVLSDDFRTIIFIPDIPFKWGERIYVTAWGDLKTKNDVVLNDVTFWFDIAKKVPGFKASTSVINELAFHHEFGFAQPQLPASTLKSLNDNNLPEDFPELYVTYSNIPSETEYYFVSPFGYWGWFPDNTPYLIVMDARGVPVFYRKLLSYPFDFKLQQNGNLSHYYNSWPTPYHIELDSSYQLVDTYMMGNGYGSPDFHEFHLLSNGHAIVMIYDPQFVDMSLIVPGGHPNAIVSGWVIQELDTDKNVVFQWRSWDHFAITDTDEHVDLTDSIIDPIHGNAIELVGEDAMLLSPRNFNEITKIDRNTGDIIWRLGGENNMFDFINDTLKFSRAHDIRLLSNGNITLFDNGTYHAEPQYSSMIEYELDEENYTATLIRRLRSEPDIFGIIMGSARQTNNEGRLIGWGSGVPGLTEFDESDEKSLEIYFAGVNYRAFRFPWTSNYFTCEIDSLDFGFIWYEDTCSKSFEIYNKQDEPITLTGYHFNSDAFKVENEFPITIQANGFYELNLKFDPSSAGIYKDVVTLNSDINNDTLVQRIAQQVKLFGVATQGQNIDVSVTGAISISPNPVQSNFQIEFNEDIHSYFLSIRNLFGKEVYTQAGDAGKILFVDVSDLKSAIYLIFFNQLDSQKVFTAKFIKI